MPDGYKYLVMNYSSRYFSVEPSSSGRPILKIAGEWRMRNLPTIIRELELSQLPPLSSCSIDGTDLTAMDTAGADALAGRFLAQKFSLQTYPLVSFADSHREILSLVAERRETKPFHITSERPSILARIGIETLNIADLVLQIVSFLGRTCVELAHVAVRPKALRWREFFVQLETAGINSVPIVFLVTFLIGVVIAYLFGLQIEKYGANILIVNAVSIAMCRELSPILVAILIAGRSGSAFTAQIGTMKLNEEIDAMDVLGLSPMRVLVVPRVLALMICMPLLVFVGDVAGILGSMVIADFRLGITGATFLDRLRVVLPERSVMVGLIKAPVFAAVIAMIGCRMGFAVENNARSVGLHTTSTVVQSIVAVILLNAAFAILFVELKV